MFQTFRNAWKIPELKNRLLFTLAILVVYRLGCAIPVPFVTSSALTQMFSNGNMLAYLDMMSGGALSRCTLFALGVTPYINASIIVQLLTVAIPSLENIAKEPDGQQKLQQITRYAGGIIALIMSLGYYFVVRNMGALKYTSGAAGIFTAVVIIATFTAGAQLITWCGEQIDDKGIGNGISLLIFAGIVSNLFNGITGNIYTAVANGPTTAWLSVLVILLMLVVMTFAVTYVDLGERRIPLQISKQVKGRRVYGGQNTHMTLKVVSVGVLPLIFAYSLLAFPGTIGALVAPNSGFTAWCNAYLSSGSWVFMILSALLFVGFTFFYSSISFDPNKQAKQLMEQGATIPGQRGKNIRDYLARTTNRLNLFAALFLAVLAVIPTLLTSWVTNLPFAASSILIAVSVSLETMRTVEGELSIRGIETDKDNGFM
mgnify:CR=1 FL=1